MNMLNQRFKHDFFTYRYLQDTLVNGQNRVGSKYSKYVYKRYTDSNYSMEIPSPPSQGYVGPLIKGEVGDIIRVHFRNLVNIPVSIHPHGVRYDKLNEGRFLSRKFITKSRHIRDSVPCQFIA